MDYKKEADATKRLKEKSVVYGGQATDMCIDLLSSNGVIICDNVLYKGMVATDELVERRKKTIVKRLREFIKYVMHLKNFESTLIPMGDGLLVSVRLNWKK